MGYGEVIELKGNYATLLTETGTTIKGKPERRVERKVNLAKLIEKIGSENKRILSVETPMLPTGARFYFKKGQTEVLVIEQSPRTITVSVNDKNKRTGTDRRGQYTVAFPYVVFVLFFLETSLINLSVFYRTTPLENISDDLFLTNLPNVSNYSYNGIMCRACTNLDGIGKSIAEKAEKAIKRFWESEFNSDLGVYATKVGNKLKKIDKRVSTLKNWEIASALDPFFILSVDWRFSRHTLQKVIEKGANAMNRWPGKNNFKLVKASQVADIMYRLKER
jgi:hypothetical protein